MKLVYLLAILALTACNDTPSNHKPDATPGSAASTTPAKRDKAPDPSVTVPSPALGSIDMGDYIISVHEIMAYHPNEMQSKMMKWNDAEKDYYIIDCSVKNKTDHSISTGKDMFSAYFSFSDGTVSSNILRGASILASWQVGKPRKYPKPPMI